jgi:5,10-methylene-tetrahydrofolate dehydrogenase/methenyl tetrahydrofolate cyclohydrolase
MKKLNLERFAIFPCTFEHAVQIYADNKLLGCAATGISIRAYSFRKSSHLVALKLMFESEFDVDPDDGVVLVPLEGQTKVEEFIQNSNMGADVDHVELTGITFWHDEDLATFQASLGSPPLLLI